MAALFNADNFKNNLSKMIIRNLTFVKRFTTSPCNANWRNELFLYFCMRQKHYNVVIAGGGLVGSAMACSLAKNSKLSEKSVIIFESSPKKDIQKKTVDADYSNRVVSLSPGTKTFFESLGVWKYIADVRYKTVKKMQVWDSCSDALITFNNDLINDLSYIVENDVILYALTMALKEKKNYITTEYQTYIKDIIKSSCNKPVKIVTNKGDEYTCNILIVAEGAQSQTRKQLGMRYLAWDYNQKGIVATLKLSEPTENVVAWQRFLPTGPIALLPLTDELCSLVWSTTTKEADELLKLNDESFVDSVNNAFWKVYPTNQIVQSTSSALSKMLDLLLLNSGAMRQLPPSVEKVLPKSRAAFPLGFGHATQYINSGIVIIGDAAHRIHPLAGQGVNLGFGDVKCLTEILADGVYSGTNIGAKSLLKRYETERQRYNFPLLIATDGLQKLYGTTFTPVVVVRTLGLQITHALDPVKKIIIDYASK